MRTVTLQIGNSDDRLPQARWHEFVKTVGDILEGHPDARVHFFGAPPNWTPWQNAAWVFACPADRLPDLRERLVAARRAYGQDSLAWTEGETLFL